MPRHSIRLLPAQTIRDRIGALSALLSEAIEGGASLGFLSSPTRLDLDGYWSEVASAVDHGHVLVWAAFGDLENEVRGSVQLSLATKPNAPHRAEVQKLMVAPKARGAGLGSALMRAAETHATTVGRTLLVLDTETGSAAEAMYAHWGWQRAGQVPGYARSPSGDFRGTTLFFKQLGVTS